MSLKPNVVNISANCSVAFWDDRTDGTTLQYAPSLWGSVGGSASVYGVLSAIWLFVLFAYSLDGRRRNVVLLVSLEFIEELHVAEQFDRRCPVVVEHSPGARFRLAFGLDAEHYTHRLHHQLH